MHSMMKLGNFKTLFLGNFQLVLTLRHKPVRRADGFCEQYKLGDLLVVGRLNYSL